MGWGGVGSMTFLAHVHIFDATSVCLSCYGDHGGVGWGGVGCCIAQKAWHNVSADCFAVVQK